jgi:hypothetical protein
MVLAVIIPMIIRTIDQAPSRAGPIDVAPHLSRMAPTGANRSDAGHPPTDLAVGGSSPSRRTAEPADSSTRLLPSACDDARGGAPRGWRVHRSGDALLPPLGPRRLHGKLVDQIVHRISRMALDPTEGDLTELHDLDQWLPQVAIGNRLLVTGDPVPAKPALPPSVPEAVDNVRRVAHDLQWDPPASLAPPTRP